MNNGNGTFTWTAPITGSANASYAVQGYATANGPLQTATVTSNAQTINGYVVGAGSGVAGSTNDEIIWTVTNYGCSNINQISIAVPAGWTLSSDTYAIVNDTLGNAVEWNVSGTTFTSPNATDRIPPSPSVYNTGSCSLVFSQTPASAGAYIFNVTITDDSTPTPVVQIIPTTVTVNPYDSSTGGPNAVGTAIWHEVIQ